MSDARTIDLVRDCAGPDMVDRLQHLDAMWRQRDAGADESLPAPAPGTQVDFDVVFAGGGLSLLIATYLAGHGVRVAVFDRARVGVAHREWNASDRELRILVDSGLLTAEELSSLILAGYGEGFCQFHGGPRRVVRGVLDRAVDAGPLLRKLRDLATQRGVTFVDGAALTAWGASKHAIVCRFAEAPGIHRDVVARLLVDARGASSPSCRPDLVCPTVGGVLAGLREGDGPGEVNPRVGEILVTTEGVEESRQHVWEGFPGMSGNTTVYLFYYARRQDAGTLLDLYARFFDRLSGYKQGDARLVRPTFGYIPGWSRLGPGPRPPHPRIVLVGDAAARHSPLTFCGFGAMLRSFKPAAAHIAHAALDPGSYTMPERVVDDQPIHGWTGPLAALMASGAFEGSAINDLLDTAFSVLEQMGNDAYAALLQDRMSVRDFVRFVHRTSVRRPQVYRDVFSGIGAGGAGMWGWNLVRGALGAR